MISKELFVNTLNELKNLKEIYDDINNAGRKLAMFEIYNCEYEDLVFKLLQEIFKDKENDWIGYYFYELDFGKEWCEGEVTDEKGTDIPLKTAEDLYDILIENLN